MCIEYKEMNLYNDAVTTSDNVQIATGDFLGDLRKVDIVPKGYSVFSILNVVVILVILSALGISVFGYTELFVKKIISIVEPILKYLGYSIVNIADTTIEQSRKGTKFTADKVADASQAVVSDVNDLIEAPSKVQNSQIRYGGRGNDSDGDDDDGDGDGSDGGVGGLLSKSKAGYCYIGSDRGVRSCVKVSKYDKCMSGDIFPRMDICINPSLRV